MNGRLIISDYCPVPAARPYVRPLLIAFGWLCVALGAMVAVIGDGSWMAPTIMTACMAPVALDILNRASRVPA